MSQFSLEDFMKGIPHVTRKGERVKFLSLLGENIPAPLLVEVEIGVNSISKLIDDHAVTNLFDPKNAPIESGRLENYYIDGSYSGNYGNSEMDLVADEKTWLR